MPPSLVLMKLLTAVAGIYGLLLSAIIFVASQKRKKVRRGLLAVLGSLVVAIVGTLVFQKLTPTYFHSEQRSAMVAALDDFTRYADGFRDSLATFRAEQGEEEYWRRQGDHPVPRPGDNLAIWAPNPNNALGMEVEAPGLRNMIRDAVVIGLRLEPLFSNTVNRMLDELVRAIGQGWVPALRLARTDPYVIATPIGTRRGDDIARIERLVDRIERRLTVEIRGAEWSDTINRVELGRLEEGVDIRMFRDLETLQRLGEVDSLEVHCMWLDHDRLVGSSRAEQVAPGIYSINRTLIPSHNGFLMLAFPKHGREDTRGYEATDDGVFETTPLKRRITGWVFTPPGARVEHRRTWCVVGH